MILAMVPRLREIAQVHHSANQNPIHPLDRVPASIQGVSVVEIFWKATGSLDLSALDRYFGPRDLEEDGSVRSRSSNLVQLQARWKPTPRWTFTLDLFNAFNAKVADIDYFYTSRLPGEPAGGVDG